MSGRKNINPFTLRLNIRSDIAITFINVLGVTIGILVLYSLIARIMGIDALGDFLLVRRTALSSMNVLLLGTNIGLPYYLSKSEDNIYGASALLLFMVLTIPLTGLAALVLGWGLITGFPGEFAFAFFIFTVAYSFQGLTYGLLRGHLNILGANLLQLLGTGIIPIVILLFVYERSMPFIFISIGLGVITLSIITFFAKMGRDSYAIQWSRIRQLLAYSIQRIPTFMADLILLAGVPLLIVGEVGKAEIAYVNSGISLIRLSLVGVYPLTLVLLPRVSKALVNGNKAPVARNLDIMCQAVLLLGLPLAALLSLNSSIILNTWLGSESNMGVWIVKIMVLGLPFYVLAEALRSPIDAVSTKGYNSIIHGFAALVLLIAFYGLRMTGLTSIRAGVISFVIGCLIIAVLSMYCTYKLYGLRVLRPGYLTTIMGFTGGYFILHYLIDTVVSDLLSFLTESIVLIAGLCLFFLKSRSKWVSELRSLWLNRS